MKEMAPKNYRNDTERFILPLIGINKDSVINEEFIGSYIADAVAPEIDDQLILVFKQKQPLVENISNYSQIKNNYYYYFNDIFIIKHIKLMIEGAFSKFTERAKEKILKFWSLGKGSRLAAILYPADYAFEIGLKPVLLGKIKEIWPKPNYYNETIQYD